MTVSNVVTIIIHLSIQRFMIVRCIETCGQQLGEFEHFSGGFNDLESRLVRQAVILYIALSDMSNKEL